MQSDTRNWGIRESRRTDGRTKREMTGDRAPDPSTGERIPEERLEELLLACLEHAIPVGSPCPRQKFATSSRR